jgi:hypothetical protein
MTQQKTAWFVQYKDNREIIVVKRIMFAKNKRNENSFTTGCTSYKHPHHMSSSKRPRVPQKEPT